MIRNYRFAINSSQHELNLFSRPSFIYPPSPLSFLSLSFSVSLVYLPRARCINTIIQLFFIAGRFRLRGPTRRSADLSINDNTVAHTSANRIAANHHSGQHRRTGRNSNREIRRRRFLRTPRAGCARASRSYTRRGESSVRIVFIEHVYR